MIFTDLRHYISTLENLASSRSSKERVAIWRSARSPKSPPFEKNAPRCCLIRSKGFTKGLSNSDQFCSPTGLSERLVFGVADDLTDPEAVLFWKNKLKEFKPVEPIDVENGPVKENVLLGADVDLTRFPWPKWHQRDGGPYICATSSVTRDPESGYINVGSYRFMLLGKNKIVAHIGSGHHGDVIRKKYWAKGKSCPVAISLGQEPVALRGSRHQSELGGSEYGFAGWMRGAPVEVTKGVSHGFADSGHRRGRLGRRDVAARRGDRYRGTVRRVFRLLRRRRAAGAGDHRSRASSIATIRSFSARRRFWAPAAAFFLRAEFWFGTSWKPWGSPTSRRSTTPGACASFRSSKPTPVMP